MTDRTQAERRRADQPYDPVERPKHYNVHPSGVECIELAELLRFCSGNSLKYLWRSGLKDEAPSEQDYKKAEWYLKRAIESDDRWNQHGELLKRRGELVDQVVPHYPESIGTVIRYLVAAECAQTAAHRQELLRRGLAELQKFMFMKGVAP